MEDKVFESFLSWTTLSFVVGCYFLTFITRRLFETWKPDLKPVKKNRTECYKSEFARWWNSFILYLIPPTWGLVGAYFLFPHLTWPKGFESLQAVMFFGMVCGWLSGLLFKFLVKFLLKKAGATEEQAEKAINKFEKDPKLAGEDKKKREVEKPEIDDEETPAETPSSSGK